MINRLPIHVNRCIEQTIGYNQPFNTALHWQYVHCQRWGRLSFYFQSQWYFHVMDAIRQRFAGLLQPFSYSWSVDMYYE